MPGVYDERRANSSNDAQNFRVPPEGKCDDGNISAHVSINHRPGVHRPHHTLFLPEGEDRAGTHRFRQPGDTTFGAFGDIINIAPLPNGWTFSYLCRLTTTPDGRCLERIGIIPGVLVRNSGSDINAGIDRVMDYAVAHLP